MAEEKVGMSDVMLALCQSGNFVWLIMGMVSMTAFFKMPSDDVKDCFYHFVDRFSEREDIAWLFCGLIVVLSMSFIRWRTRIHKDEMARSSEECRWYKAQLEFIIVRINQTSTYE